VSAAPAARDFSGSTAAGAELFGVVGLGVATCAFWRVAGLDQGGGALLPVALPVGFENANSPPDEAELPAWDAGAIAFRALFAFWFRSFAA
jgi:hypothetical protein